LTGGGKERGEGEREADGADVTRVSSSVTWGGKKKEKRERRGRGGRNKGSCRVAHRRIDAGKGEREKRRGGKREG